MTNPWLALDDGADPAERVGQIGRAHEGFLSDGRLDTRIREVVAESWRRSARSRFDPDTTAPIELTDDALESYREAHPLARVLPIFRELLGGVTRDGGELMAICDADGRLLWVEGHPGARRRAERMNFVPGARWDETHAGTNAPGTALALDHSVQIFATEHFSHQVQPWTCAAAPIHDPHTGRLLGAVDVTGGDRLANPYSLALVQAAARAAETHLAGPGAFAAGPAAGTVAVLGRDEALIRVNGRRIRLTRRHSELLAVLLSHPQGRTGEQLNLDLYGEDPPTAVTLRAELSRLRRVLGAGLLDSRPYRLRAVLDADLLTVTRRLDRGEVAAALRAYPGPLLPGSEAPAVLRLRRFIDGQLRAGVLASRDPELLIDWARTASGAEDLQVWERLAAVLPAGSSRRALALDRVRQLADDYALPPYATWPQRFRR